MLSCPECNSKNIIKKGIIKGKLQTTQRYQCKDCKKLFSEKETGRNIKNKTYPAIIILGAISSYNLGYSQTEIQKLISKKHKIKVPQRTISQWVSEFREFCPYQRLRQESKKHFEPEGLISSYEFLHNNLNYKYQIHSFKLSYLTNNDEKLSRIKLYLNKVPTKDFPHHIFKPNSEVEEKSDRASQSRFSTLSINPLKKQNLANKLTSLALSLAKTNKERHQAIQDFFITNDSTTVATEVPVYLTHDDLLYFNSRNFSLTPNEFNTPITGHIDLLQIRNNLIHILDYKPEASRETPIHQLTIYALALASKTKLPLTLFKCAWFDENNYYEFFPLHVVYKLKNKRRLPKEQTRLSN